MQIETGTEQRLRELLRVFLEENTKLNLSALRTEETCWNGNILDSLPFLDLTQQNIIPPPASLIDVGTGGGFPLLPLAVALPEVSYTGLDSTRKKVDAIGRIGAAVGLQNLTLVAERAEIAGQDKAHRLMYDVATARAVAPVAVLLEYCVPLVKVGGHVVLWKSLHIDEELAASDRAQKTLRCTLRHRHEYDLGGDWGKRQLLVFSKDAPIPNMYPRAVGVPGKTPIA